VQKSRQRGAAVHPFQKMKRQRKVRKFRGKSAVRIDRQRVTEEAMRKRKPRNPE